jgi:uncharacterized membrane protein YkvA (DUF1232 family)
MSRDTQKKNIIRSNNGGMLQDVVRYIKLIWLLMSDKRVNLFLKVLPVASMIYLVSPIDLIPGMALPIIGALDDAAIIWIGTSLFISLCPEHVVDEHMLSLAKVIDGKWQNIHDSDEIVEAEARDILDDQP